MYSLIKKQLKRAKILSVPIRFLKQIRPTWKRVENEIELENLINKSYERRNKIIEQYFSKYPIRKLQIGAGTNFLPGWLNSDLDPIDDEIIFLDAKRAFPFSNNVFDYVYFEHMIEHISYKDGMEMIKQIFRVLKPGGKIRIATPDIIKIVGLFSVEKSIDQRRYIAWKCGENIGLYSPEPSQLQRRRNEWDIDYQHIKRYYPNIEEDGVCFIVNNFFRVYGHKYLYDRKSLMAIVGEAGFENISMAFKPNESDDEHFRGIKSHASLIGEEMNIFETMVLQAVHP